MTTENQNNSPSTLPLRGLAMVLIAVAVLLGLWALYSFTQGDGGSQAAPTANNTTAPAPAGQAGGSGGADSASGASDAAAASGAPANQTPANGDAGAASASAGATAAEGAPAAGDVKLVNVLNNSTVQGLAAEKGKEIEAQGYQLGEVGNFSTDVLTETTVFFPAGDAGAEASARTLASTLGGVAKENIPELPQAATAQRSLTVVLVNQ